MKEIISALLAIVLINVGTAFALPSQAVVIITDEETTTTVQPYELPVTTTSTVVANPPYAGSTPPINVVSSPIKNITTNKTLPTNYTVIVNASITPQNKSYEAKLSFNLTAINQAYNLTAEPEPVEPKPPLLALVIAAVKTKKTMDIIDKIEAKSDEGKPFYEIEGKKHGRLLGLIPVNMEIAASMDAASGEVYNIKQPWWSFLVL